MGIWNASTFNEWIWVSLIEFDPIQVLWVRSDPIWSGPVRSGFCQRPTLSLNFSFRVLLLITPAALVLVSFISWNLFWCYCTRSLSPFVSARLATLKLTLFSLTYPYLLILFSVESDRCAKPNCRIYSPNNTYLMTRFELFFSQFSAGASSYWLSFLQIVAIQLKKTLEKNRYFILLHGWSF